MFMTKAILLALLVGILPARGVAKNVKLPATHPVMVLADSCADDVIEVCSLLPEYARATWCPITYVFANLEGGCEADPKCPAGTDPKKCNDDGKACGVMQTHNPEWEIKGATCAKVKADRKLGLRVGMVRMIRLSKECGSVGAGLTAYAMKGECPKGWVLPLVKERLKLAGGIDPSTPWSPGA